MSDFEFVPTQELKKLEQEITRIKSHPIMQDEDSKKLQSSMTALYQSMERMLDVFRKATDDMELEEREDKLMQKHMGPVTSGINAISEQNETLAEGVVNISDTLEELKSDMSKLFKQQRELAAQLADVTAQLRDNNNHNYPSSPQMHYPSHHDDQMPPPMYDQQQQYPDPMMNGMPPPPPPSNSIPSVPKNGLAKKKGFFR